MCSTVFQKWWYYVSDQKLCKIWINLYESPETWGTKLIMLQRVLHSFQRRCVVHKIIPSVCNIKQKSNESKTSQEIEILIWKQCWKLDITNVNVINRFALALNVLKRLRNKSNWGCYRISYCRISGDWISNWGRNNNTIWISPWHNADWHSAQNVYDSFWISGDVVLIHQYHVSDLPWAAT
jgi:hypothetical protein